jgi:hypothetical protein
MVLLRLARDRADGVLVEQGRVVDSAVTGSSSSGAGCCCAELCHLPVKMALSRPASRALAMPASWPASPSPSLEACYCFDSFLVSHQMRGLWEG